MQILLVAAAAAAGSPEQCDGEAQHDGHRSGADVADGRVDRNDTHQRCLIKGGGRGGGKLTILKVVKAAGKLYDSRDSCSIWPHADGGGH